MSEYGKVVSENKDDIKLLIEIQRQLKLDIAQNNVNKDDTENEIAKTHEVNDKLTHNINKIASQNKKLSTEIKDLQNLIQLIQERTEERNNQRE